MNNISSSKIEFTKDQISSSKSYDISINNSIYPLTISLTTSDTIFFKITPLDIYKNSIEYILNATLNDLKTNSEKMFTTCKTIKEAYENILYMFTNKTYSVNFINNNDNIKIGLYYNLFGKEISADLLLNIQYIDKLKLLEMENSELKIKVEKLSKDNKVKSHKIKTLKTVNEDIYKQLMEFQKPLNNYSNENLIIQSKILSDVNQLNFVINHLKKTNANYGKKLYFNLLFRATEVGEKNFDSVLGAIFNNRLFDFVLIKTKRNYIFGYKYLPYMFRFSINLQKIYVFDGKFEVKESMIYGEEVSMQCHYFISIFKKVFTIGGMCRQEMKKHYTNVEYDYEFNGGEEFFKIDEMEVYKIRF